MMLAMTLVAMGLSLCCPILIPFWLFVLVGFYSTVRKQYRTHYLNRYGREPKFGTWDWVLVYL